MILGIYLEVKLTALKFIKSGKTRWIITYEIIWMWGVFKQPCNNKQGEKQNKDPFWRAMTRGPWKGWDVGGAGGAGGHPDQRWPKREPCPTLDLIDLHWHPLSGVTENTSLQDKEWRETQNLGRWDSPSTSFSLEVVIWDCLLEMLLHLKIDGMWRWESRVAEFPHLPLSEILIRGSHKLLEGHRTSSFCHCRFSIGSDWLNINGLDCASLKEESLKAAFIVRPWVLFWWFPNLAEFIRLWSICRDKI